MALMVCRNCGCRFAVGLSMCPQCTSEKAVPDFEEEDMGKSTVLGGTTVEGTDGVTRAVNDDGSLGDPIEQAARVVLAGGTVPEPDADGLVTLHDVEPKAPAKKAPAKKTAPRKSTAKTA